MGMGGVRRLRGKVSSITSFNLFSPFPPVALASLQVTAAWLNYLPLALKLNGPYSEGERQGEKRGHGEREHVCTRVCACVCGDAHEKSVHGHVNAISLDPSIPPAQPWIMS